MIATTTHLEPSKLIDINTLTSHDISMRFSNAAAALGERAAEGRGARGAGMRFKGKRGNLEFLSINLVTCSCQYKCSDGIVNVHYFKYCKCAYFKIKLEI